jgi:hypothetical protein
VAAVPQLRRRRRREGSRRAAGAWR